MVEIGITKRPSTGEYRVFWKENGRDIEARAYYTNDYVDAVDTLFNIEDQNRTIGIPTRVSDSRSTMSLVRKYNESFGGMIP